MNGQASLYHEIWARHVVADAPGGLSTLYIDLHLVQETTFLQAYEMLRSRVLPVRRTALTLAVTDHSVPTAREARFGPVGAMPYTVQLLLDAADELGLVCFGPNHEHQGIVHVIGPELGASQPGMTIVCADSHTSTHGALGALAFGIGTTEVGHALATQCLLQRKQQTMRVSVHGSLGAGVTSKDVALAIMAQHGIDFGRGHVIEFAGRSVRAMSMEARMSLCNMSIEMGSRSGLVAPDDTTLEYLYDKPLAPKGEDWERAVAYWRALAPEDRGPADAELEIDGATVAPMVTFGTTPGMAVPIDDSVPVRGSNAAFEEALAYMGIQPGVPVAGLPLDRVFVGSCTNSRIEDLRLAAQVLRGRKVADTTTMLVVPGSQAVKRQAESEGLDDVFTTAGALWGEPSCSLCVGVNGDLGRAGEYIASTSNRNFQGRQGAGVRTLLMSPATAAASAVEGAVADPRPYLDSRITVSV